MNYKYLLSKYINHVVYHEGMDFLTEGYQSDYLSKEDWEELIKITLEKS